MSGEVINLRLARKAKVRLEGERKAEQARALHGRTKGQRLADQAEVDRLSRRIEQSRLEPPRSESETGDDRPTPDGGRP